MCKIFETSIEQGEIPKNWSTAVVVPLPEGCPSLVEENYIPVCYTSSLSEVPEKLIRMQ